MPFKMTMSTDNWRPDWWGAEKCFERIREIGEKHVELTTATGFNLLEGLGFSPYVSVDDDPYIMRDLLAKYGLEIASIDCDYPIWSYHSIDVLNKTIVWGDMIEDRRQLLDPQRIVRAYTQERAEAGARPEEEIADATARERLRLR